MRKMNFLVVAAAAMWFAVPAADSARAQGTPECFDSSGSGSYKTVVDSAPGAGQILAADCDGSVNTVFRNRSGLAGLTDAQLIAEAFNLCDLPNGPYRRVDTTDSGGDRRLDYVIISTNTPAGAMISTDDGGQRTVLQQIGIDPGIAPTVMISGSSSANSGTFSIEDVTVTSDGTRDQRQILDVRGFEWVAFLKSSGSTSGTLVCDVNMWYNDGSDRFGVKNFNINHGVNNIVVAWAGGPSGFEDQEFAEAACADLNFGLTINDQEPDGSPSTEFQEKFTSSIMGFYKTLAGDPPAPTNVTACSTVPADFARYCDSAEPANSVNSCNPEGGPGGAVNSVAIGVQGTGTDCLYSSGWSGTTKTRSIC